MSMNRVEDDMALIHKLHEAHGDATHCNYCNCQCALCRSEGWKYRPEAYGEEVLTFEPGDLLYAVESDEDLSKGDKVLYLGNRQFKVLSEHNKGALITFFANSRCAHLFTYSLSPL